MGRAPPELALFVFLEVLALLRRFPGRASNAIVSLCFRQSVLARATEDLRPDRRTHGQTTDGGRAGRWTPPPPPSPCRLRLEDEPSLQGHGRGAPHQGRPAGALCPPGRGALMRAPLQRDDPVQAPGTEGAPVLRDSPSRDAQIHSSVQR